MENSLWLPALLWILLIRGVAPQCGSSQLLVDPCNQNQSVAVNVCVLVGTSLTIVCDVQDTAAAWQSPNLTISTISPNSKMSTWLDDTVDLKYINHTSTCILSSATIHNVQPSMNGLDLFCWSFVPGRSGANISIVVLDGTIASVKQIGIDLTTDDKHVDLDFSGNEECQFDKYLISEGSCSQQDDQATTQTFKLPTLQGRINVNSFSGLSVSAYTEEDVCTCQEIDLDDFTVTRSQELPDETSYSVLLSFSHDVLIDGVGVSPQGNRANCSANNQTSRRVMLSCSNLSNDTTYSITVQGKANLNKSGSVYQYTEFAVSLDFLTALHVDNETVNEKGLSGGAITGIVIGTIVFVIIIIATPVIVIALVLDLKRRSKERLGKEHDNSVNPLVYRQNDGSHVDEEGDTNKPATTDPSEHSDDKMEKPATRHPSITNPQAPTYAAGLMDELKKRLQKNLEILQKEQESLQKKEESRQNKQESMPQEQECIQQKRDHVQRKIANLRKEMECLETEEEILQKEESLHIRKERLQKNENQQNEKSRQNEQESIRQEEEFLQRKRDDLQKEKDDVQKEKERLKKEEERLNEDEEALKKKKDNLYNEEGKKQSQ